MTKQKYENYWKITLEYTDIHGENFLDVLRIIIDFIDAYPEKKYSEKKYEDLQKMIYKLKKKNYISIRKGINQFIKLGFVDPYLNSYHSDAKEFLNAKTIRIRNSLFSKIIYTNASFNRSVTTESNIHEINFLLKTLEHVGSLNKKEIGALMTVDIEENMKGYLIREELDDLLLHIDNIGFLERKYNQNSYLMNILNKLVDLKIVNGDLYFEEDAISIFGETFKDLKKRDPYLQRIYKNFLEDECEEKTTKILCMLEKLEYPSLVASHIKPFRFSDEKEAYDPNNGLLLSRNMDLLFDRGYISFDENGIILISDLLSIDLRNNLQNYFLSDIFLTQERKKYLEYHRKNCFKKKS